MRLPATIHAPVRACAAGWAALAAWLGRASRAQTPEVAALPPHLRKLQSALDTSTVPFCLIQRFSAADGSQGFRWDYLNPAAARLARRPAEELVGRPVRDTLAGAAIEPGLRERAMEALHSRKTTQLETWLEAGGQRRWFQLLVSPHEDGLAIWFTDITRRRRQEDALRQADRRKDEFLATLAHELRNPLAAIRQAAQIARAPVASPAQKQRGLEVVERQVAHMALLLDDLLDVSRITRGRLELRKLPVPLAQPVEAALEATRPHIEARQQSLAVELAPQALWVNADGTRLTQVVSNLLANASKYTPAGGRIALRLGQAGARARIEVSDSGIGLPPQALDTIFEMFTQLQADGTVSAGGLGIGLALARGLVELHGGSIRAASPGPGQGSTFTVDLPLVDAPAAPAEVPAEPTAGRRVRRVLVADDNRDAAESLADLLRMEGHEVALAFDGEAALRTYDQFLPDAALLDIGMPGLNGNQVAGAIRSRPQGSATLLVAVTGWGQERDRAVARQAGFDHHFTKPVDPRQVLAVLGVT